MAGRRVNGFTLIEMLIAMTLLGVLVVLLFSSMRIAAETWNAGQAKMIQTNKKAIVYQFFKSHLSSAQSVLSIDSSDEENGQLPSVEFVGHPASLRFVAGLPISSARKGLQIFTVAMDSNSAKIMVSLTPYVQMGANQTDVEAILDHVKSFSFSYFGMQDPSNGVTGWTENWGPTDHLPALVKIRIQLDDGSFWPDMLIPVKINGQLLGPMAPSGNSN